MKKRGPWLALGGGFLLITALWFVAAFVLRAYIPTLESRGLFGDSYGALNALFSGLAFAGVVFAILQQNESRDQQNRALELQLTALELQQKDLALQIEELKATRAELKRHADAAEKQEKALDQQRRAQLLSAAIGGTSGMLAYAAERSGEPMVDELIAHSLNKLVERALAEVGIDKMGADRRGANRPE